MGIGALSAMTAGYRSEQRTKFAIFVKDKSTPFPTAKATNTPTKGEMSMTVTMTSTVTPVVTPKATDTPVKP